MTTDLTTEHDNDPIKQFRDKVADRIRSEIGDLMPAELLQEIVKQSIEAELNSPVHDHGSRAPWIQYEVRKHLKEQIHAAARAELDSDWIKKELTKQFEQQLPEIMSTIVLTILRGQAHNLEYQVSNIMNSIRNY